MKWNETAPKGYLTGVNLGGWISQFGKKGKDHWDSFVTENTIAFERDGVEYQIRDADTLVFANGYHVDSAMEDMLKEAGVCYHLIGDGAKVGNIKDAISGAYEIARNL